VTAGSGWQQSTAEKRPTSLLNRGVVGTRRERRNIPHDCGSTSLPQRKIVGNAQKYRQQLCRPFSAAGKQPENLHWVLLAFWPRAELRGAFFSQWTVIVIGVTIGD